MNMMRKLVLSTIETTFPGKKNMCIVLVWHGEVVREKNDSPGTHPHRKYMPLKSINIIWHHIYQHTITWVWFKLMMKLFLSFLPHISNEWHGWDVFLRDMDENNLYEGGQRRKYMSTLRQRITRHWEVRLFLPPMFLQTNSTWCMLCMWCIHIYGNQSMEVVYP